MQLKKYSNRKSINNYKQKRHKLDKCVYFQGLKPLNKNYHRPLQVCKSKSSLSLQCVSFGTKLKIKL